MMDVAEVLPTAAVLATAAGADAGEPRRAYVLA
jgi:hypothetical protein